MIRDSDCALCKLGPAAQQNGSSNVCLPGEGVAGGIMVVSARPLGKRRMAETKELLEEAGIDLADVFYTAANRCLVWDVMPSRVDVKACRPYLEQEIAEQQPSVVIALGNEPLLSLTGHSGIMKWRGRKLQGMNGSRVVATVSPPAVTRNPGLRAGLVADLRLARRAAEGSDAPTPPPTRLTSVTSPEGWQALKRRLRTAQGAYLDIETNMFDEHRPESRILTIAMTLWDAGDTEPRDVWAVPLAHPSSPWMDGWRSWTKMLCMYLEDVPKIIAHNGKFDLRWLHQFGRPLELTFDTMLAAHLIDENRPKALESLCQTLLGVPNWKIDNRALIEQPLARVLRYNALDTWYGAHLYFVLRDQLMKQPRLARLMKLMMVPASNVFVPVERHGIWTDREKLATNSQVAQRELEAVNAKLRAFVPPPEMWPEEMREINFNASNFARWWLFDWLELPVLERGKTRDDGSPGMPSMAESIMQRHAAAEEDTPGREVARLLLERVKWQKYVTAFFAAYEEQIDEQDRIHTTFKITGTVTGRLSSGKSDSDKVTGRIQNRGVNLQQVPRDSFVRGIFGAPPGSLFVECDYSQVELRVAAFLARERTMLSLYSAGQDIHMTMAMRMTGKPASEVTKEERKKAKAVNFGFLYGMGWRKFIETAWTNYGVVVTEEEAQAFRKAFFGQFPDLPFWHNQQRRLVHKYARVESPLGRIRHLPDIRSPDEGVRHEAERQAINSPVQSFASDLCLLSLIELDHRFRVLGYHARSVGTVHDAINFEVPVEEVSHVVPIIRRVMESLPLYKWFGLNLTVPIIADVKIGRHWGDALEVPSNVSNDRKELWEWLWDHSYELELE